MAYQNSKERPSLETMGKIRFYDGTPESKKTMAFKYWKDKMAICIQVFGEKYYEDIAKVYLSPFKAQTMILAMEEFLATGGDMSRAVMTGLDEKKTICYFKLTSDGQPIIVICSIDANGKELNHEEMIIRGDEYITFDGDKYSKFDKVATPLIAMEIILVSLKSFVAAVGGAQSHFNIEGFLNANALMIADRVKLIKDKMNIPARGGNYSRGTGGSSYFDGNKGGSDDSEAGSKAYGNSSSYEDIESMLED